MKFQITLRTRLVMLVMAAIVPLFGLSIFKAMYNAGAAVERAQTDLQFAASLAAASQQQVTETARQVLTAIANVSDVRDGKVARCDRYLGELRRLFPVYVNLGIVGADGYARCHGLDSSRPAYLGDRAYFRDAVARRGFVVGEYIVGRLSGKPTITFALPVLDGDGRVTIVAYASLDLGEMAKSVAEIQMPPGAALGIHDRHGILLAGTAGLPIRIGQKAASPVLLNAVKTMGKGVREGLDSAGQRRLWAFMPSSPFVDAAFFVAVSIDRDLVVGPGQRQLWLELAALALMALFGAWLAWMMGGRAIVKPATEILDATRQVKNGRLDVRIPIRSPNGGDEFAKISEGFNLMIDSLQQRQRDLDLELERSRQAYSTIELIINSMHEGLMAVDATGRFLLANEPAKTLFSIDENTTALTPKWSGEQGLFVPDTEIPLPFEATPLFRALQGEGGGPIPIFLRNDRQPQGRLLSCSYQPMRNGDDVVGALAVFTDVTRSKLTERALMDSEQRYAALFESAPVPMWVYDIANWQFLTVNQAAVEHYDYSSSEFLSMTVFDIRPESEHERFRKDMANIVPGQKDIWLHCRKDGSVFPVDVVLQPIQYAGRAALFVVALDVTAQVKAEKDVQEHLFTLQRAADAAQAITWHQTLDGMLQEVAEQARGVIGAHQAVVSLTQGDNWVQAITALSLSDKYAKYRDLIATPDGTGIYALVCENNRSLRMTQAELEAHPRWRGFGDYADKHPPMRGWLAVPLTGRSGNNIGLLQLSDKYEGEFTPQDEYVALELAQLASIAIENARLLDEVGRLNVGLEQKVAERTVALARQEALFRALAEQAPEVVWTSNPDGGATYCNRAWFELVGGEMSDWTGNQWLAAIHPEDLPDVKASWKNASANQSQYAGVRRVLDKDGSYHTMSYRASPVLDEQGDVVFWVGIDTDITEIKAIEAALRLSNQELEAFSYSVSHDLRSPLNTIDGFSRLLAKQLGGDAGKGGEKVQHYLSRIQAGVAQMGQLIEGMLSLAQVSRVQLLHEPVDLSALAHNILQEWQARNPERQLTLRIEKGLQAHGDGRLVRVVMENLIHNACKFTSQQARADLRVGQKTDAAGLPIFFVSDNGAGFDMAYADKLFNPFQRLHAVSEFPGTGVGLATVSRVIRRHGGRLWAESEPGRGATFFFTLPKAPVSI
ncbi:MAG TPA: PAS domain S-box protein [Polaromonas sp.]